jgi:hypothetical protein
VTIFTLTHVVISLVGIGSGFVVLFGLFSAKRLDGWTALFLVTTVLTSVTGFFFPVHKFMPSHALEIICLLVLALAIMARYPRRLGEGWRSAYVISAVIALYFNVFVLVVQVFGKVPALKALAPTQSEPPFAVAQSIVLILFILFGILGTRRFRGEMPAASALHPRKIQASQNIFLRSKTRTLFYNQKIAALTSFNLSIRSKLYGDIYDQRWHRDLLQRLG